MRLEICGRLLIGVKRGKFALSNGSESSEEWGEDPAIVPINAVVVNHRITFAVDGHADERSRRAFIAIR